MLILIILAAVLLSPMAYLVLVGPGETPLMTTPKNLGLPEADLIRPVTKAPIASIDTADAVTELAHRVPVGMATLRDAALTAR